MSIILGINTFHAGASAAILVDGKPVAAIAEERLNRVKYYAGFPAKSILSCLKMAGLSFRDVDYVAVGRNPKQNLLKKIDYALRNPLMLKNFLSIRDDGIKLGDMKSLIATHCDISPADLRFRQFNIEHHLAHIASSFFISDFEEAAGFSVDGSGDFVTAMLAKCQGNKIYPIRRIYVPHSLGLLYSAICGFIGYLDYGDEGKVMGLAPYGKNTYEELFGDMLKLTSDGFSLNLKYFKLLGAESGIPYTEDGRMILGKLFSQEVVNVLGEPRIRGSEITQRDKDIALGLQNTFEKAYLHLIRVLENQVPSENLVLAGGCALNSVANGKIFDSSGFKRTCIQPAAADDGLAVGAALYVSQAILNEGRKPVSNAAYLGPEYTDQEIESVLEKSGISFEKLSRKDLIESTVKELEGGKVVGWFQGRMEWGPRALGNRSILAHPGYPGMKDILNARIKKREPFRPFAPAVLAEKQSEIFEHSHPSPYMLHVYKIKQAWRERLSAVNHFDNTGRLQTVSREENPLYYDLIKNFGEQTGIPVLLNTSFNENEPIICNPSEAVDCFKRTKMDVLAIGSFFCVKSVKG